MAKDKEKEKKAKTPKALLITSLFMTISMTILLLVVLVIYNPDATKMVKDMKLLGSHSEEEFYGEPIEFMAEVTSKTGNKHYMQAAITVSLAKEKEVEKIKEENVKLNDLYIRYFGTQNIEDLKSLEGQKKVKEELKKLISEETGKEIRGVYFTKWIFQ